MLSFWFFSWWIKAIFQLRTRSNWMVRTPVCQCRNRNSIWVRSQHPPTPWNLKAADEPVLKKVLYNEKPRKSPFIFRNNCSLFNLRVDYCLEPALGDCNVSTVIRFLWVSAKFGTCTVVSLNGTLVEDKMRRFKGECAHFSFNKCPIYTHDGAGAKFSTNSHETDYSVPWSEVTHHTKQKSYETLHWKESTRPSLNPYLFIKTLLSPWVTNRRVGGNFDIESCV